MRLFIEKVKKQARKNPKAIVFPESTEPRTLEAIDIILKEKTAKPILIGSKKEILKKIRAIGLEIDERSVKIIDINSSSKLRSYAKKLFELRKEKGLSKEQALQLVKDPIYYGTMMVYLGDADGLISGAVHSTAHTIKPALQIIKTRKAFKKVSGVFFMKYREKIMLFADAVVEIAPDAKDLADIAIDTARTAKIFGLKPRVAMLSFSTKGSANHPLVDKIIEATKIVKYREPKLVIDGEMQLDAAVIPEVAQLKAPGSVIKGDANVLIFPDLQSANIGYKLARFFGNAEAIGPILQGLQKPVNDLSRSCSVQEIVDITAMTVIEAQKSREKRSNRK